MEAWQADAGATVTCSIGATHHPRARRWGASCWVHEAWIIFQVNLHAHLEWVAGKTFLTATVKTAQCVEADSIHATGIANTFVHVDTLNIRVSLIADWAHTVDTVHTLTALCTTATFSGGAVCFFLLF